LSRIRPTELKANTRYQQSIIPLTFNRSTPAASLLGVKFGVSQMTSHAGGGDGRSVVSLKINFRYT